MAMVETLSTTNVDLQRMICSLVLETDLAAQKSLLSLIFMIEFLRLYPDLVGVERRFPFGELKGATEPDNEPKDSSDTEDDDDENEDDDTDIDEDDDDEDHEGSDDDDEDSDGDDAGANANGGDDDDTDDEDDEDEDEDDDEDDDEEDDEDDEDGNNQPPYKKIK